MEAVKIKNRKKDKKVRLAVEIEPESSTPSLNICPLPEKCGTEEALPENEGKDQSENSEKPKMYDVPPATSEIVNHEKNDHLDPISIDCTNTENTAQSANEHELVPSAPPDSESYQTNFYPILPTLCPILGFTIKEPPKLPVYEHTIKPFTQERRETIFYAFCPSFLKNVESHFLRMESYTLTRSLPYKENQQVFYKKLQKYGRLHHAMDLLVNKRKVTQNELTHLEELMWYFQDCTFQAGTTCSDDRDVIVKYKSRIVKQNLSLAEKSMDRLAKMLDNEIHEEKKSHMKCRYLHYLLENIITAVGSSNDKYSLKSHLSVLAYVIREEEVGSPCSMLKNCPFLRELREWFKYIASRLMDISVIEDRLFVLFHVLRFQGGISSWAVNLIQPVPKLYKTDKNNQIPLSDENLRFVLVMLNAILNPITDRNRFMFAEESEDHMEQSYTFVDSDGDSDDISSQGIIYALTEHDLIALLDQMPFQVLFQTLVEFVSNKTDYQMLRAVVLADTIVQVLSTGCSTYRSMERYKNFRKRLGLLISHTVSYICDAFSLPTAKFSKVDPCRVQIELDLFIFRASCCLFKNRNSGLWQYLVSLPFEKFSTRTLWWLYDGLKSAEFEENRVSVVPKRSCTSLRNVRMADNMFRLITNAEFFYVANMLVNMAHSRNWNEDYEFINAITQNFLELITIMTECSEKDKVQYLIVELRQLTNKHPRTVSTLLNTLNDYGRAFTPEFSQQLLSEETRENLLTVFHSQHLPMNSWIPDETDIEILLCWFDTCPFNSIFHSIASHILTCTVYGENGNGHLIVTRALQVRILRKIVSVYLKYVPTMEPDKDNTEYKSRMMFTKRCINLLQQLHVHAMDQPMLEVQCVILNQATMLSEDFVKHLSQEPELQQGVWNQCVVACLAALLITTAGHWLPVFCQDGIPLLEILIESNNIGLVIRCLELIVPLFAQCHEALTGNVKFLRLIRILLQQPHSGNEGQTEFNKLELMIVSQINQHRRYGMCSPAVLVTFWTECIIRASYNVDITYHEPSLKLLNRLAFASLSFKDAWNSMREQLGPLFMNASKIKPTKSRVEQIMNKLRIIETPSLYFNLPFESLSFALLAFEVEHEQLELKTELWPQLLHLLGKELSLTVDDALARVSSTLKLEYCPPANMLVLYKQARLLTRIEIRHPLFILLCQQFITILLTRIKSSKDEPRDSYIFGIADRLCAHDETLMHQVKERLCHAENYYSSIQATHDMDSGTHNYRALFAQLQRMLKAFGLWMDDNNLNNHSIEDLDQLPIQYCVPRLKQVFQGAKDPWIDLVNWTEVEKTHMAMLNRWLKCFRSHSPWPKIDSANICNPTVQPDPASSISRRFGTYITPVPLPKIFYAEAEQIHSIMALPYKDRNDRILTALRKIDKYTHRLYQATLNEFKRLKEQILEKMTTLYSNVDKTVLEGAKCGIFCTGAGYTQIRIKEPERSQRISKSLDDHWQDLWSTVEAAIYLPPVVMEQVMLVKLLWMSYFRDFRKTSDVTQEKQLVRELRILLSSFFAIVQEGSFADHMCYTVKDIIAQYLISLPDMTYQEIMNLFKKYFRQNQKPPIDLVRLIDANKIPLASMFGLYRLLTSPATSERILFVEIFGQGFNMNEWLQRCGPTTSDITQFLMIMSKVLIVQNTSNSTAYREVNEKFFQFFVPHLVVFAHYQFPNQFVNVLQLILDGASAQTEVPSTMLLELVNSLRAQQCMPLLQLGMDVGSVYKANLQFAEKNATARTPLLSLKLTSSLLEILQRHFNYQRYKANSIGLYLKHKDHVEALALLIGTIANTYMVQVVVRGYNITEKLQFVLSVFEPWLVTIQQQPPQQWRPPWNFEDDLASFILETLLQVIKTTIDQIEAHECTLNASDVLLELLLWYNTHYSCPQMQNSLLDLVHKHLITLPWNKLRPSISLLACFTNVLHQLLPKCHQFIAKLFVRCHWDASKSVWLEEKIEAMKPHSMLLEVCVKLTYEPSIRNGQNERQAMVNVLQELVKLPWASLDVEGLEPAMDFYTRTADSSVVLRSPTSPDWQLDEALLDLIQIASGIDANTSNPLMIVKKQTDKQKLFIRTTVRQLVQVSGMTKKTVTVTNVKKQVLYAVRILLTSVAKLLDEMPEASEGDFRGILTEILLGIQHTDFVFQSFIAELTQLLNLECNWSMLLAYSVLAMAQQFTRWSSSVLMLIETALVIYLNTTSEEQNSRLMAATFTSGQGKRASWQEAYQLVEKVMSSWDLEMLANEGLPLCMQLHFMRMYRTDPLLGLQPNGVMKVWHHIKLLKNIKKEKHEYTLYPLWFTLLYVMLTKGADLPLSINIQTMIQYLMNVGQQCSPGWLLSIVQTLIAARKSSPTAVHRIVALGLAHCLSAAYRTFNADNEEHNVYGSSYHKDNTSNVNNNNQLLDSSESDENATITEAPAVILHRLLDDPDFSEHREAIADTLIDLQSHLEVADAIALARTIIERFDERCHFFRTLLEALE